MELSQFGNQPNGFIGMNGNGWLESRITDPVKCPVSHDMGLILVTN